AVLERLVAGERQRSGALDSAFAGRPVVDEQAHGAPRGDASAVVVELHPHEVDTARNVRCPLDVEQVDAVEVVAVLETSLLRVDRPAPDEPTLGNDHSLAGLLLDDDLCADTVRLVL